MGGPAHPNPPRKRLWAFLQKHWVARNTENMGRPARPTRPPEQFVGVPSKGIGWPGKLKVWEDLPARPDLPTSFRTFLPKALGALPD